MIFISCSWVYTRWQWSLELYKIDSTKGETIHKTIQTQYTKQYKHNTQNNTNTIQKHRIHEIENQNTKQKANKKNIKKNHKHVLSER
jgi:hypothetical protein